MFDLAVTKRDPKTGQVVSVDDYYMHIDQHGTRFEKASEKGSGKFYTADGKPWVDPRSGDSKIEDKPETKKDHKK